VNASSHTSGGILQVDLTSDRRSWGVLGGRRSRMRLWTVPELWKTHTAFPTSSLDGAENAPPTTAHKALLRVRQMTNDGKMTRPCMTGRPTTSTEAVT
jgi:hypothetical protein